MAADAAAQAAWAAVVAMAAGRVGAAALVAWLLDTLGAAVQ